MQLNNISQNNLNIKSFNNPNFTNNINKSISMNNSVFNFLIGNKKSLSVNKFMKINKYQNMTLLNNYPNIMIISLSQGKTNKFNKINNNLNKISSTFYSFKK